MHPKRKKIISVVLITLLVVGSALAYGLGRHRDYPPGKPETAAISAGDETILEDRGTPSNDDPWEEMDKLVSSYYNKDGISCKGTVKVIDDNGEQEKILEEHPFEYSFHKGDFAYTLDSMEMIAAGPIVLAIDHRGRTITISRQGNTNQNAPLFDLEEFRKMMLEQKAEASVTVLGSQKILTIEKIQHPQIQGYSIYYDPATHQISRVLVGMLRTSPLNDEQENSEPDIPTQPEKIIEKNSEAEIGMEVYTYYIQIDYREKHALSSRDSFNPVARFFNSNETGTTLQHPYEAYEVIDLSGKE